MDSASIDRLESLLSRKRYEDLDADERDFVLQQLGSADEYKSIFELNQRLNANATLTPDPLILESLQRRMRGRREIRFSLQSLLRAKVPAPVFYVAVVGLIILLLNQRSGEPPKPITYIERDTVFVSALPDTVFVETVIYKTAPAIAKPNGVVVTSTQRQNETATEGVNMRERQELEALLESGS